MKLLNKKDIFPFVKLSTHVEDNYWNLWEDLWGEEETPGQRLVSLCRNVGIPAPFEPCGLKTNVEVVLAHDFASMERRLASLDFNRNAYLRKVAGLISLDPVIWNRLVFALKGICPLYHVAFPEELSRFYILTIKNDLTFRKRFYQEPVPENNSLILFFEKEDYDEKTRFIFYGVGRFRDVFVPDAGYFAIDR